MKNLTPANPTARNTGRSAGAWSYVRSGEAAGARLGKDIVGLGMSGSARFASRQHRSSVDNMDAEPPPGA